MKKTLLLIIAAALFTFPTIPVSAGDGHIDSPGATCVDGHIDSPGLEGHIDSPGAGGHIDSPGADCKTAADENGFAASSSAENSTINYIQALIAEYSPFKFF